MTKPNPTLHPSPDPSSKDRTEFSQEIRNRGSSPKIRRLTVTP
jgi:hypothetical protein